MRPHAARAGFVQIHTAVAAGVRVNQRIITNVAVQIPALRVLWILIGEGRIGASEPSQRGPEVAGVEVIEAGFGACGGLGVARLAGEQGEAGGGGGVAVGAGAGELGSVGGVVEALGAGALGVQDEAGGAEVVGHEVLGADGVGRAAVFGHELAIGAVDVVGGRAANGAADAPAFGIVVVSGHRVAVQFHARDSSFAIVTRPSAGREGQLSLVARRIVGGVGEAASRGPRSGRGEDLARRSDPTGRTG